MEDLMRKDLLGMQEVNQSRAVPFMFYIVKAINLLQFYCLTFSCSCSLKKRMATIKICNY